MPETSGAMCKNLVMIGSSTGGPETLRRILSRLPLLDAAILIVQHMPKFVNESVRAELAGESRMPIRLAADGLPLEHGVILLAPSEMHLVLDGNRTVRLIEGEKVNYVRPSVDVAMKSLRSIPRVNVIGVILTGMGCDGAEGIKHIKLRGGATIAQDEASSVIYGMPKAAADTGHVDFILAPELVGDKITEIVRSWSNQGGLQSSAAESSHR